ncbi:glycosyl hydrolase [Paenibacillus sp. 23TSA30-6]|uniref:glycosyl hydrolase n=1 Tax=Paenibacillus sp. 23TSA30-6 TaxID=2546104 RepID=UPI001787E71D|nr:glycosyl hydrolase [Paenibacillus sp. 23TSA30-6]MBE0338810.1 beta-mannosidase [Paenibacillus sp. 23TSA30-6]
MKVKNSSSSILSKRSKWLPVVMACTIIVGGALPAPTVVHGQTAKTVTIKVDTSKDRKPISPYIYGTNQDLAGDENLAARRLGGNRMTGYNWENNMSNAGSDWQQSSDNYLCNNGGLTKAECEKPGAVTTSFHDQSLKLGTYSLVTLPMAGYVAKDGNGSVQESEQAPSARWNQVVNAKNAPFQLQPDLNDNQVYADEFVNFLVKKYGAASTKTGVKGYALDNEPALWSHTHPRIHGEKVGAKELVDRSVSLSKAVKAVDAGAEIFGPVLYGFGAYTDLQTAPDWNSVKGNYSWFVDYYLDQMRLSSQAEGKRLLDVFDVHWYPEAMGGGIRITNEVGNDETKKARMQAPRTLWDPTYKEDSWIAQWNSEFLPLLPRLKQSVDKYYPGTKLALTEYSYGGENDISGGIAMTDVLGILGKNDVYMANYWKLKDGANNYVSAAYKLYRNYDGKSSTFGDISVNAQTSDIANSSVHASVTDASYKELHLVVMNKSMDSAFDAQFDLSGETTYGSGKVWGFDKNSSQIKEAAPITQISGNRFTYTVPPLTAYHIVLTAGNDTSVPPGEGPESFALRAEAGDGKVDLSWDASSGVVGYSVQRATYENGPFTAVASNLIETSYTDTNVTNGTSYYYKVTAKTKAGTSESNVLKAVPRTPVDGPVRYEAEDGTLKGTTVESSGTGFSGTGYVTNFHNAGDSLTMTIQAEAAGLYNLAIGYRSPYDDKRTNFSLNGKASGELVLWKSADFKETSGGKVLLNAGANTIGFETGWGWYDIDYVKLEPAADRPPHAVTKSLINPNATVEAKALMNYLVDQYGKNMLSGQEDMPEIDWLQANVGKKPAIAALDLIDYSPSRAEHGLSSTETEKAIEWDKQGGIVTFAWHWNAPKGLIDTQGKEWWRGFYADSTTFDIEYAMNHPESEDYKLLIRDIDVIAGQLKKLQDAKVPVLFRPLHEAEGKWFWWGAKGPEPVKKLYILMHDRLTNKHKLNNLIWVWNSVAPDWYPGDEYVDILSFDSYPQAGDYSPQIAKYEDLVTLGKDKKLVAMSENGPIPDPDLMKAYQAHWSWFATWYGDFLRDGKQNSLEHLKKVYNHPNVITLEKLPTNLKTYGITEQPSEPGSFTLNAAGETAKVKLSWTASAKAVSYEVKRSTAENGAFATVASDVYGSSYTDTAVTADTTYYYQVVAKNDAGQTVSNTASAAPKADVQQPTKGLLLQYRAADTNVNDNNLKPHFQILNKGTTSVPINELKIRYYYTIDGDRAQTFNCDYAMLSCSKLNGKLVKMDKAVTGADYYLEVSFNSNAGVLAPGGSTGEIQTRTHKTDWSNYNESDDYSYKGTQTSYANHTKATLYHNGVLVWGTEPTAN